MPKAPKEVKRPTGRQPAEIDWKLVDDYLEAGCVGTDIAAQLGVYPDTLYDRCQKEKGTTFTAYSQQKKQAGDYLLKKAQFDKAIGRVEHGDNTLLIWLGKVRLDQKETTTIAVTPETEKNYRLLMEDLAQMQQSRQNVASNKAEEPTNESGSD